MEANIVKAWACFHCQLLILAPTQLPHPRQIAPYRISFFSISLAHASHWQKKFSRLAEAVHIDEVDTVTLESSWGPHKSGLQPAVLVNEKSTMKKGEEVLGCGSVWLQRKDKTETFQEDMMEFSGS